MRFKDFPVFWEVMLYHCMPNGLKDCSVRMCSIKLDSDDEGTIILPNVADYSPSNAASISRRVKCSATLL